jgi:8-hydroxy-5-deazaflavin:NADPH oxidoreductase
MQVGIIGGTGPAGRGFAARAADAGHDVLLGSRDEERAGGVAAALVGVRNWKVNGCTNADAAAAEIVVAATPWDALVDTVRPLEDAVAGTVVISMANALVKEGREMLAIYPSRGSMAGQLQAAVPKARVTAALHHLPAAQMEDLDSGLEADVLVCGDDPDARAATCALIDSLRGLRALEVGSLAQAGAIEAFTAVCVTLNIRHKAHSTLRLGGI